MLKGVHEDYQLAHSSMRNDIFTLEWALRSVSNIPDRKNTSQSVIRSKWNDDTARKCFEALTGLANYPSIRDLVITTKRVGYTISCPQSNILEFRDVPNWMGYDDQKSRIMSQYIQYERLQNNLQNINSDLNKFSIAHTFAHEDYPFGINGRDFTSDDFWGIWDCLVKLCVKSIEINSKIHTTGGKAHTSHTKNLLILRTKKGIINEICNHTNITKKIVSKVIDWLSFNSETPKKLTLFHCPIIDFNNNLFLILPHAVLLSYPPTSYSRLLAHHEKKTFDSYSLAIEKKKLNQIENNISSNQKVIKTRVMLGTESNRTEIDLVEYDKKNRIICIVQAKFFIAPDSVAEVDNANRQIQKAVEQLEKNKKNIESSSCDSLFTQLFNVSSIKDIQFEYFLLSSNFSGSDFLSIPLWIKTMLSEFCLISKFHKKPLIEIWHDFKKTWDSLDEEAKKARIENIELNMAGYKIIAPGFKP